jgi:hypothetical protein
VANVGQSVRSAVGEDVFIRDLQDGDTRVHFVKAAADHGFPDIQNAPAETVMIPEPALQGPVDKVSRVNYLVRFDDNYDGRLSFVIFSGVVFSGSSLLRFQ